MFRYRFTNAHMTGIFQRTARQQLFKTNNFTRPIYNITVRTIGNDNKEYDYKSDREKYYRENFKDRHYREQYGDSWSLLYHDRWLRTIGGLIGAISAREDRYFRNNLIATNFIAFIGYLSPAVMIICCSPQLIDKYLLKPKTNDK